MRQLLRFGRRRRRTGRGGDGAGGREGREGLSRRLAFGREKRLMLGVLALVAPFPLPFNEALGWGVYAVYAVLVAAFLVRARRGEERWLPVWAANLLALAYLPFLGFDLFALSGGGLVGPVLHLGLFAVLVKLWSLRQERDKWHAALGIFFLFVAASATSVHLSVTFYLAFFMAGILLLLARFAFLHLLTGFGHRDATDLQVPLAGFVAASVAVAVVVAVPLFALLPRVNNPYIGGVGRGISSDAFAGVSGFSDEVTLDSIGALRTSREVALRLTYDGMPPPPEIRLKGGAFDHLEEGRWRLSPVAEQIRTAARQEVQLISPVPELRGEVEVWLQPLFARGLPVPVETVRLASPVRTLNLSEGGALSTVRRQDRPLQYRAWLAPQAHSAARRPQPPGGDGGGGSEAPDAAVVPTLDTAAVTPRMAELAAEVAGEGTVAERAARLERHLVENFEYTLSFVGSGDADPLEEFLFVHRSGHCEYFASALVLLLRAEGIHARLATGFLGGELNPLGYVVVRQANAHAWVEAWIPGEGWTIFDPTPPAGRPGVGRETWAGVFGQVYDSLVFQWERYVLSYGVEDQVDFVYGALRKVWGLLAVWRDEPRETAPVPAPAAEGWQPQPTPVADDGGGAEPLWPLLVLSALILAGAAGWALWRHRRDGFTATRAYRRLRRHLDHFGLPLTDATGPLDLRRRALGRWPALAEPAGRLVDLYLRESFGGRDLGAAEREEARAALYDARRALRGG